MPHPYAIWSTVVVEGGEDFTNLTIISNGDCCLFLRKALSTKGIDHFGCGLAPSTRFPAGNTFVVPMALHEFFKLSDSVVYCCCFTVAVAHPAAEAHPASEAVAVLVLLLPLSVGVLESN